MPNAKPKPNDKLSDGVHGVNNTDSDVDMSRPIWESHMVSLGDYIQHMRKVADESYQSYIASESDKSSESSKSDNDCSGSQHAKCDNWCTSSKCVHGCNRECNCNGNCACIDDEQLPNSIDENRNKNGKQQFDYYTDTQGIPIPVIGDKGQVKYRWVGPGVIVGAVCEAWNSATKRISGCFDKSVDSKRDANK